MLIGWLISNEAIDATSAFYTKDEVDEGASTDGSTSPNSKPTFVETAKCPAASVMLLWGDNERGSSPSASYFAELKNSMQVLISKPIKRAKAAPVGGRWCPSDRVLCTDMVALPMTQRCRSAHPLHANGCIAAPLQEPLSAR